MKKILGFMLIVTMILTSCSKNKEQKSYTGIVEGTIYTISSPVSDELKTLFVQEGQWVHRNDLLGLIDTTDLKLQLKKTESLIRELELRRKNAEAQMSIARDQYQYFEELYQKNKGLVEKKAISSQKLRDIKLKLDQAQNQLEMASVNKRMLREKQMQAQYQLKLIQEKINKAILYAPQDGVVDKIYYDQGEIPPPFSPIMDIVHLDTVWCYVYLAEVDLSSIQIGQKVKVMVDGMTQPLLGKVAYINHQAEFTPKNIMTPDNRKALVFGVKITIANSNHVLKPGMPVEVEL